MKLRNLVEELYGGFLVYRGNCVSGKVIGGWLFPVQCMVPGLYLCFYVYFEHAHLDTFNLHKS